MSQPVCPTCQLTILSVDRTATAGGVTYHLGCAPGRQRDRYASPYLPGDRALAAANKHSVERLTRLAVWRQRHAQRRDRRRQMAMLAAGVRKGWLGR